MQRPTPIFVRNCFSLDGALAQIFSFHSSDGNEFDLNNTASGVGSLPQAIFNNTALGGRKLIRVACAIQGSALSLRHLSISAITDTLRKRAYENSS